MYRPGVGGLGNILIHLTQCDVVSDTIYKGGRDNYIKFENISVQKDDGTLPDKETHIHIGNPIHSRIRDILKPTSYMQEIIDEYEHLVKGVEFAIQIRRCGLAKNFNEQTKETNYCTDETLKKFYDIMNRTLGDVYVTSDCQETKQLFKKIWPDRVRILDKPSVHTSSDFDTDPLVPILEFFLLSKCPFVFCTGGDPKTGMSMSTYGYMAAIYGNKPYSFIFN